MSTSSAKPVRKKSLADTIRAPGQRHSPSVVLYAAAGFCVAAHFLFLFVFPGMFNAPSFFGRAWGFHFITYYSPKFQIAFYALAVALCCPPVVRLIAGIPGKPVFALVNKHLAKRKEALFAACAVASVLVFYLARAKYAFLGDNFGIVERAVNNSFMPDEFGAIFVLHWFYRLLHAVFSLDGMNSLRIFGYLCGGIFIYVSLRIADELGTSVFEKTALFLAYASFATIQHFCGYIEDYASTVMLLPLYLYTSLLCIRGKASAAVPGICLAAAVALHFESLMFAPLFLFVLYGSWLRKNAVFRQPRVLAGAALWIAAAMVYPVWKLVIPHCMPLFSGHEMTLFSLQHFWEYANGQLLGCGPPLFAGTGCLAFAIVAKKRLKAEMWFLLGTSLCVMAGLFVFRSALGSADWDVFSYSSLAVNILAPFLLLSLFGEPKHALFRREAMVVIIGFMLLHTAPWIFINAGDKSVRRFEDIIATDPAYGWDDYPAPDWYRPRICRMAMRMEQNGLLAESFALYRKAYEADTTNELHNYNYFVTLCKEKEAGHAVPIMYSLAKNHPAAFMYRFRQILEDAQGSGDNDLSCMVLQKLYDVYNEHPGSFALSFPPKLFTDYFRQYIDVLLARNAPYRADSVCRTVLSLEPENGINHYNLARAYFEKGEYDSVIAICTMLNRAFPGMPLPNALGAEAFRRKQGGFKPARDSVPAPALDAGGIQPVVAEKDPIEYYESQLRLNANNVDAHNNLGVALADRGQIDLAVLHYKEAVRLNPSIGNVHFNLGNAYAEQGKPGDAIGEYEEALRLDPKFAEAHNNLGNTLAQTGRVDEAVGHFRQALSLKPGYLEAEKNLRHALKITGSK